MGMATLKVTTCDRWLNPRLHRKILQFSLLSLVKYHALIPMFVLSNLHISITWLTFVECDHFPVKFQSFRGLNPRQFRMVTSP